MTERKPSTRAAKQQAHSPNEADRNSQVLIEYFTNRKQPTQYVPLDASAMWGAPKTLSSPAGSVRGTLSL